MVVGAGFEQEEMVIRISLKCQCLLNFQLATVLLAWDCLKMQAGLECLRPMIMVME